MTRLLLHVVLYAAATIEGTDSGELDGVLLSQNHSSWMVADASAMTQHAKRAWFQPGHPGWGIMPLPTLEFKQSYAKQPKVPMSINYLLGS